MSDFIELFSSKYGIQLFNMFIDRPDAELYQNEIIGLSGLSANTVIKWLKNLVRYGLLKETWKGGLKLYSLNRDSPVVRQLKILLNVAAIYEAVEKFAGTEIEVYLYGSTARGEDIADSDIDLLILGKADDRTVVQISRDVETATGRPVSPLTKTPVEYAGLSRTNSAFYESINRDRIRIV